MRLMYKVEISVYLEESEYAKMDETAQEDYEQTVADILEDPLLKLVEYAAEALKKEVSAEVSKATTFQVRP